MLLKISLGLAILIGLATLYVTHVEVGGRINTLTDTLATTEADLQRTRESERQAKADVRSLRGELEVTQRSLTQATNDLQIAMTRAEEQQRRADLNAEQLRQVTAERNEAQQEVNRWRVFGMTPEQIRNQLATLRDITEQRDAFSEENEAFERTVSRLRAELSRYRGIEHEVQLPPGTKGNVVAVDPKYDFVVLDIGENQGVLPYAKMLVNRDGKLIGKVEITQVKPNRSIANVIQDWETDQIMEGDQVIF